MISVSITLQGTLPFLMHSQEGMNMSNVHAKEYAILSKKRSKQADDFEKIADLEMRLGTYWDHERDIAVCPTFNVIRCIQDGGKMLKLGKKIIQGVRIDPRCKNFEMLYSPRLTFDQFILAPTHRDTRTVTVSGTVNRTRPIFHDWGMRGIFLMDPEILSLEELNESIRRGGLYYGLGDFRVGTDRGGRFGTFEGVAKIIEEA